jgi:hypothetical protein
MAKPIKGLSVEEWNRIAEDESLAEQDGTPMTEPTDLEEAKQLYERIMRLGITKQGNQIPGVIALALSQAEKKGMEKAAKIADGWPCPHDMDSSQGAYEDSMKKEIAAAIREGANEGRG